MQAPAAAPASSVLGDPLRAGTVGSQGFAFFRRKQVKKEHDLFLFSSGDAQRFPVEEGGAGERGHRL